MQTFDFPSKIKSVILALGAESAGNFSIFYDGKIHFSENFGDLSDENNFKNFKKNILNFLKKENLRPQVIISDLHPLLKNTLWADKLSRKYKAKHIQVQHHHAHIFTSIGDKIIDDCTYQIPNTIYGIAMDGTGYGLDEKIWGGECFAISNFQFSIFNQFKNLNDKSLKQKSSIVHIGGLENQKMPGGELAVKEPARILIAIISKFLRKEEVYKLTKRYYTPNEFNLIYSQIKENFHCQETSSTGRILDAASLLLGFAKNERKIKHQATILLEKNSTKPYLNIKPVILKNSEKIISLENYKLKIDSKFKIKNSKFVLQTTPLFEYLIKNINRDKNRLAATAQRYISQGLLEIVKLNASEDNPSVFISGGISKNKTISNYLASQGVYLNKKISPGDEGLSFGQIIYYLYF